MTNTTQNKQNDIASLMFGGLLKSNIHADIDRLKLRKSAWNRAIKEYMHELLEDMDMDKIQACQNKTEFKTLALNGADSWHDYSWGGCSLIYNEDIAERTCSPSELKKTKGGQYNPNKNEAWLDVQARCLYQACNKLFFVVFQLSKMQEVDRKNFLIPA